MLVSTLALMTVYNFWEASLQEVRIHTFEYFMMCMIGGVLSGLPHTWLVPIDLIKCRTQVGEYTGFTDGVQHILKIEARSSWVASFPLFFRGWVPTFIGYSLQGALKFGLYEFFKYYLMSGQFFLISSSFAKSHKVFVFLMSSCFAELIADVFLAPWEAVKIKMQTTRLFPPRVSIVVPRMWQAEGSQAFFKGLVPLWARQVPYTMMKFASFEKIVELLFLMFVPGPAASASKQTQLMLSLLAGFTAGTLCALVSHPADTVVSKLNQRSDRGSSLVVFISQLGCKDIWKGLALRLFMIGTLTALQWVIYDSFKVMVGLPTTGGGGGSTHHQQAALVATGAPSSSSFSSAPAS